MTIPQHSKRSPGTEVLKLGKGRFGGSLAPGTVINLRDVIQQSPPQNFSPLILFYFLGILQEISVCPCATPCHFASGSTNLELQLNSLIDSVKHRCRNIEVMGGHFFFILRQAFLILVLSWPCVSHQIMDEATMVPFSSAQVSCASFTRGSSPCTMKNPSNFLSSAMALWDRCTADSTDPSKAQPNRFFLSVCVQTHRHLCFCWNIPSPPSSPWTK